MTRKTTQQETCPLHTKYTARNPGACPITQHSTIQDHLRALLDREAGQPLDPTRHWPHDRATRRAIRSLAGRMDLRPRTLRRHARGTRWPAGAHGRAVVDRWVRAEFCLDRIVEREAREARLDALAAVSAPQPHSTPGPATRPAKRPFAATSETDGRPPASTATRGATHVQRGVQHNVSVAPLTCANTPHGGPGDRVAPPRCPRSGSLRAFGSSDL